MPAFKDIQQKPLKIPASFETLKSIKTADTRGENGQLVIEDSDIK
jgi:hypothetical protein